MLNSQTTTPHTKNTSDQHSAQNNQQLCTPKNKLIGQKRCLNTQELYEILMDESTASVNESCCKLNMNKVAQLDSERYSC